MTAGRRRAMPIERCPSDFGGDAHEIAFPMGTPALPHHSPCRKAVQRREETADHQFVGGREPVWPAPSSKGPGATLRTAPTLGGGSAAGKGEP